MHMITMNVHAKQKDKYYVVRGKHSKSHDVESSLVSFCLCLTAYSTHYNVIEVCCT